MFLEQLEPRTGPRLVAIGRRRAFVGSPGPGEDPTRLGCLATASWN
jgi:hypothetical protein